MNIKISLSIFFLAGAVLIGTLYILNRPADSPVVGKPRLETYLIDGSHAGSGLLTVPFTQTRTDLKYINILLAGRWVIKNMPAEIVADTEGVYSFLISSLDVSAFDVTTLLTQRPITGAEWDDAVSNSERDEELVQLFVGSLVGSDCGIQIFESAQTPILGGLPTATGEKRVEFLPADQRGCFRVTEQSLVFDLETVDSDEALILILDEALKKNNSVMLVGTTDGEMGQTVMVRIDDTKMAAGDFYIRAMESQQASDKPSPNRYPLYRLDDKLLQGYSYSAGEIALKYAILAR